MPVLSAGNFPNFFNTTRPSVLTGKENIPNFAQRTNYPLSYLMKGRDPFDTARGGQSIIEIVQMSDAATAGAYNPGDFATITMANTSSSVQYPWKFRRSQKAWTDAEYNLHTSGGDFVQVKNFVKLLDQQQRTAHVNDLDATLFARPSSATMESTPTTTGTFYSIPAWISEDTTRYRPPSSAWSVTTIGQNDVTVNAGWRNKVELYDPGNYTDIRLGILAAFDRMLLVLTYNSVPEAGSAFQPSTPSDLCIFTHKGGYTLVQSLCRNANDRLKSVTDPAIGTITFDGVPFIHAPQLDTELLEQSTGASAAYTGNAYPQDKPRFYVVNKKHLKPVFMEGEFMNPLPVIRGSMNQPDVNVAWMTTTGNTVCNNRSRCGIIAPNA